MGLVGVYFEEIEDVVRRHDDAAQLANTCVELAAQVTEGSPLLGRSRKHSIRFRSSSWFLRSSAMRGNPSHSSVWKTVVEWLRAGVVTHRGIVRRQTVRLDQRVTNQMTARENG